jgi:cell division protein FtsX
MSQRLHNGHTYESTMRKRERRKRVATVAVVMTVLVLCVIASVIYLLFRK